MQKQGFKHKWVVRTVLSITLFGFFGLLFLRITSPILASEVHDGSSISDSIDQIERLIEAKKAEIKAQKTFQEELNFYQRSTKYKKITKLDSDLEEHLVFYLAVKFKDSYCVEHISDESDLIFDINMKLEPIGNAIAKTEIIQNQNINGNVISIIEVRSLPTLSLQRIFGNNPSQGFVELEFYREPMLLKNRNIEVEGKVVVGSADIKKRPVFYYKFNNGIYTIIDRNNNPLKVSYELSSKKDRPDVVNFGVSSYAEQPLEIIYPIINKPNQIINLESFKETAQGYIIRSKDEVFRLNSDLDIKAVVLGNLQNFISRVSNKEGGGLLVVNEEDYLNKYVKGVIVNQYTNRVIGQIGTLSEEKSKYLVELYFNDSDESITTKSIDELTLPSSVSFLALKHKNIYELLSMHYETYVVKSKISYTELLDDLSENIPFHNSVELAVDKLDESLVNIINDISITNRIENTLSQVSFVKMLVVSNENKFFIYRISEDVLERVIISASDKRIIINTHFHGTLATKGYSYNDKNNVIELNNDREIDIVSLIEEYATTKDETYGNSFADYWKIITIGFIVISILSWIFTKKYLLKDKA